MSIQVFITLIAVVFSLAAYWYVGARAAYGAKTSSDFLGAGRSLDSRQISHTWFASTVAFGTAAFYYMQIVPIWGWVVLFASIGTYALGQWIAIKQAKSAFELSQTPSSITKALLDHTGSTFSKKFIDLMNYFQSVSIIFLEIFLGITIFTYLLPDNANTVQTMFLLGFCAVTFAYVSHGGLRSVVASDTVQFYLILLGLGLLLLSATSTGLGNVNDGKSFIDLTPTAAAPDIALYFVFALLVNLSTSLGQIAAWQKILSAKNAQEAMSGGTRGVVFTSLAFAVFVLVAGVYNASGSPVSEVGQFFDNVAMSLGAFGAFIALPIVFTAMVAAIVSTVDSAAIAAVLAWQSEANDEEMTRGQKRNSMIALLVTLVLAASGFLYVTFYDLSFLSVLLPVAFFAYSVTAFYAPLIFTLVRSPQRLRSKNFVAAGLVLGFVIVAFGSFLEAKLGTGNYTYQIATTLTALVVNAGLSIKLGRN